MTIVELSQVTFHLTATLAIIIITAIFIIMAYEINKSINNTRRFIKSIKDESIHLYSKLDKFLMGIAALPLIKLFKKKKVK